MSAFSKIFGGSSSSSVSNPSYISKDQLPYLTNLWQQAQNIAQTPQMWKQQAQEIVDPLRQQGQQFLGGLANNPYMRDQYTPSQAYQQQMSAGQQQIGQTMDRANWSAGQTGIQAGQFGAGRQQVASGLIGEAGVNAASNLSGQLMGQDMQNQLGQAGIFAQSALGGLSSLQGLYGLGMSPMQAAWTPLGNQAAIYGNPAIIGGGGSSRSSSDTGIVNAFGNLFGGFA